MAAQRATATIVSGTGTHDVAVPVGTTVAGLLAMLQIDTSAGEFAVTRSDGGSADLAAMIGADLPSGVVLAVTESGASAAAVRAARATKDSRFASWAAVVSALLFVVFLDVGVLGAPLLMGLADVPWPARVGAAALAVVLALALVRREEIRGSVAGSLGLPALLGAPVLAVLDPAASTSRALAPVLATTGALLAAFVIWIVVRRPLAQVAAGFWGVLALCITLTVLLGGGLSQLAPLLLAASVYAIRLVPNFSMPVPESQLVDLPALTTSASAVRAPNVVPPGRITRPRIMRSVEHGAAVTNSVTMASVAVAVVSAPFVLPLIGTDTPRGWGALATVAAAVVSLALFVRHDRSPLVRRLPRFGAGAILGAVAVWLAALGGVWMLASVGGLTLIGIALAFGTVQATREPGSVLLSRIADIVQGLALVVVLPAALIASGAFDLIRQVAS